MSDHPASSALREAPVTVVERRRVLVAVGVALVTVVVINTALAGYLQWRPVNPAVERVDETWERIAGDDPVDWLILGDSSCGVGLDPEVLTAELGGSALNLCTFGNLLVVDGAWMLQHYIETVGVPRHVIVMQGPDVFARGIDFLSTDVLEDVDTVDLRSLDVRPHVELSSSRWPTRLRRWVPLWWQEASLRALLREPELFVARHVDPTRADGFRPVEQPNLDLVAAEAELATSDWAVWSMGQGLSPINADALEVIARLAQAHGFSLDVAFAPVTDTIAADPGWRSAAAAMASDIERVIDGRGVFLTADVLSFSADQMETDNHVVGPAQAEHTRLVADQIRAAHAL